LKTTDKYGDSTLDIRAIRTLIGLPVLLVSIAAITSACSSRTPRPSTDSNEQAQEQQTIAEQPVSFEPAEETAETAQSMESAPVAAQSIQVNPDYPQRYTVAKGDTLWDIAGKFLKDPWFWPEIWHRNPQVENPHLIYPGDILSLIYVDGIPQIQITRAVAAKSDGVIRRDTQAKTKGGLNIVKLAPGIRRISRASQIPTIPSDAITQFISRPKVVTKEEIDNAPYIVSSDGAHLILGSDNKIYIRGELDKERVRYTIYRKGAEFIDPQTKDILGYEVIYAGEARIDVYGDPATALITSSSREILVGDFLMTTDKSDVSTLFYPKVPTQKIEGQIVSLFDALSSVASFQIVVVNRGADEGIEVGHLLASYYKGGAARDKYLSRKKIKRGEEDKEIVQLPDERSGLMMVFRVFDRVSYALVLESTRVIRKYDVVKTPR
jgi:hypothetical protein